MHIVDGEHGHAHSHHTHEHTHEYTHSHEHVHEEGHEHEHTHEHEEHTHCHEEGHEHCHDHSHGEHTHSHDHGDHCGCGCHHEHPANEQEALLTYMLDHNKHHAAELLEIAKQVRAAGKEDAAVQIEKAVENFDKGNLYLSLALSLVK